MARDGRLRGGRDPVWQTGIYLSILGVGLGNLNDALMQRLAQAGNGNAAYIDSMTEARKVLSDELSSTLFPIADDVKVQVELNPAAVSAYRLIGYETRVLRREDFADDRVDAGDVGAGRTVTAVYEMVPAGARNQPLEPLRYQAESPPHTRARHRDEFAYVKLRYKLPGNAASRVIRQRVHTAAMFTSVNRVPADQRFAIAVAAFGQRLRGESAVAGLGYGEIALLAAASRGEDREGYRLEFARLVWAAEELARQTQR